MRKILDSDEFLLVGGVQDCLSAKIAEKEGIKLAWISGHSLHGNLWGQPDVGMLDFSEVLFMAERIANSVNIPIIIDGEEGFGNAIRAAKSAQEFERANLAGMQLSDYGRISCPYIGLTKERAPVEEVVGKIRAIKDSTSKDFVLISTGSVTTERAREFVRAGADAIYGPTGYHVPSDVKKYGESMRQFGLPVFFIYVPWEKSPTVDQLQKWGFKGITYSVAMFYAAVSTFKDLFREIIHKRTSMPMKGRMMDKDELLNLLNVQHYADFGEKYFPSKV